MKNTSIEWCHHTFNHVSGWKEPLKWNRDAAKADTDWQAGVGACEYELATRGPYQRPRVFCASLADVFEDWKGTIKNAAGFDLWHLYPPSETWTSNPGDVQDKRLLTMDDVRARLFRLIDATPNLDWLLLTKRPENIAKMWPSSIAGEDAKSHGIKLHGGMFHRPNVWLGVSVEDQKRADERRDFLERTPAAVRFVSYEPALGTVNWAGWEFLDWMIIGGESGPGARPFYLAWARQSIEWCKANGVAPFVKQIGSVPMWSEADIWAGATDKRYDKKGGDMEEWPRDLRVRQFPETRNQCPTN